MTDPTSRRRDTDRVVIVSGLSGNSARVHFDSGPCYYVDSVVDTKGLEPGVSRKQAREVVWANRKRRGFDFGGS